MKMRQRSQQLQSDLITVVMLPPLKRIDRMKTYRVRYLDKDRVNCISIIEADGINKAISIARRDYSAISILECDLV